MTRDTQRRVATGLAVGITCVLLSPLPSRSDEGLHDAIRARDRIRLERLLDAGHDVEAAESHGRTPLYTASREGLPDLAALLLARGARIDAVNTGGLTPLHAAASRGRAAVVEILLANCAPIEARDAEGRTPLHLASARGHVGVATLLLDDGADLQARGRSGTTILEIALRHRQPAVADLLRIRRGPTGQVSERPLPPVGAGSPPSEPSHDSPVARVQEHLKRLGYRPGGIDGVPGRRTRDAIATFQSAIGQVVTGNVSDCLIERLDRAVGAPRPPPGHREAVRTDR